MKHVRLAVPFLVVALLGAGCFGPKQPTDRASEASSDATQPDTQAQAPTPEPPAAQAVATSTAPGASAPAEQHTQPAPKPVAHKPMPSQPTAVAVSIGDTSFSPGIQVVQAGGKVVWTNKSSKNQTVHSVDSNLYDSGNIPPGQSWSHVFPASGSYYYYTATDLNMKGTIIVR